MKKKIKSLYIAVDGSSASGKTTASKIISKKFKLKLLSSGKLYRYIAYKIIKNKSKYNKNIIKNFSKSISDNFVMRLYAPRNLKEKTVCKSSLFSQTVKPSSFEILSAI